MTREFTDPSPAPPPTVRASLFRRQWLGIVVIMLALVLWAMVHAWGAYQSQRGQLAVLKGLFVLLSMAIFLASWGALLWLRHRKISYSSGSQITPAGSQNQTSVDD
jgi:drug/metabolite transporter (DMT)-like permease